MQRPSRRRRWTALVTDSALAALMAAIGLVGTYLANQGTPTGGDWRAYPLIAIGSAALVARRRIPLAALGVTWAVVVAALAFAVPHEGPFILLPALVALYTAAAAGRRLPALGVAATLIVAFVASGLLGLWSFETAVLLWVTGWLAVSIVAGEVARSRSGYLAEVEARALEAERTRDEEARRRAGEERLRIARELHDVLAHHISIINVQAGVAAHLNRGDPDQTEAALLAIKQASKDALRELRATLGVLRDVDGDVPRAPTPGLAGLDDLVAGARAAGLEVDVRVEGTPWTLPGSVDLAAFRIVQEALTNVVRHAGASRAAVRLEYGDALVVEVDDDGNGPGNGPRPAEGGGILGMRERVHALDGTFDASGRPGGGFRVRAVLPVNGQS